MEPTGKSVDEHLDSVPEDIRPDMVSMDDLISEAMPGFDRVLWVGKFWGGTDQEIIGYGHLSTANSKGVLVDWFHVGLAAQKNHMSVYVNVTDGGRYLGAVYGDRLGRVKVGSASLGFKSVKDVNLDVFTEMIRRAAELAVVEEGQ
jgi:hypothetical protein